MLRLLHCLESSVSACGSVWAAEWVRVLALPPGQWKNSTFLSASQHSASSAAPAGIPTGVGAAEAFRQGAVLGRDAGEVRHGGLPR